MKKGGLFFISYLLVFAFATSSLAGIYYQENGQIAPWSYDDGPNPEDPMGKELIDLIADAPYMPRFSEELLGKDKFRKAFGPTWWRMLNAPANSMKILFIGQDATHIAEAAERTATAGFGGRAQDLAKYFGVNEGAGFINWSAFTIRGQYGAYNTPYLRKGKNNQASVQFSGVVDNDLWLMGQDPDSPMTKTRNQLIDWIIRRHKDSLRLIVLFGGAARDAAASFVESKGGKVGSRLATVKTIQVPLLKEEYAGGNNTFPVPLSKDGGDFYAKLLGRDLDYTKESDQKLAMKTLKENASRWLKEGAFALGGVNNSGIYNAAQIGGYDLGKMTIDGKKTLSLRGLPLDDGTRIKNDILVTQLPHPSYLSRLDKKQASVQVAKNLKDLKPYVDAGWTIKADNGLKNNFAAGQPYVYGRADIGPEYYDFGTPETRMVPVSTASRLSGNPHVIVFGTRDRVGFDLDKVKEMTNAKPATMPNSDEMYITRPRGNKTRYSFDPGPGEKYARLMKENLNEKDIFKTKSGKTWGSHGIDAYNVKTHPDIGDFGHYRGTFENPKVLILADPQGYDDLITARALTGTRGQYLHGLMQDLGVDEDYLVLKTVPFGMDEASKEEWEVSLRKTDKYREELIQEVLADNKIKLILTDGPYAAEEMQRVLGDNNTPVVHLERQGDGGNNSGIAEAAEAIKEISGFKRAKVNGKIADIPRSHLSFYARVWQGTSGDRVLAASDKGKGLAFASVAPDWATEQDVSLSAPSQKALDTLIGKLEKEGLQLPGESVPDFLGRQDSEEFDFQFDYQNASGF